MTLPAPFSPSPVERAYAGVPRRCVALRGPLESQPVTGNLRSARLRRCVRPGWRPLAKQLRKARARVLVSPGASLPKEGAVASGMKAVAGEVYQIRRSSAEFPGMSTALLLVLSFCRTSSLLSSCFLTRSVRTERQLQQQRKKLSGGL